MNLHPSFAYSDLPAPVAAELEAAAARIRERLTQQVRDILATGRDLLQIKDRLDHGQFESWLAHEFNMTGRTAQKYMRAAEWMADKSELSSFLSPTSVYMLSAKSTPDVVHDQIDERIQKGWPVEPERIRDLIKEAKVHERKAKNRKGKRQAREARKRRAAREERQRRKEEDERQHIETATIAVARQVADILVNKLSKDEINKVYDALGNFHMSKTMLRETITAASALGKANHQNCRNDPGDDSAAWPKHGGAP